MAPEICWSLLGLGRMLFIECPFVMWLSHPQGSLLKLLMACWVYEEGLTKTKEQENSRMFLEFAFQGLNALTHRLWISDEVNREVSKVALRALYPEM